MKNFIIASVLILYSLSLGAFQSNPPTATMDRQVWSIQVYYPNNVLLGIGCSITDEAADAQGMATGQTGMDSTCETVEQTATTTYNTLPGLFIRYVNINGIGFRDCTLIQVLIDGTTRAPSSEQILQCQSIVQSN